MQKSLLTLLVGIFLSLGIVYFLGYQNVEAVPPAQECLPLLGVTSGVAVPVKDNAQVKVENSGRMYFSEGFSITESNYVESVPYPEYRVCVIDKGKQATDNDVRYVFEGWTIDSNLGWVSWSCKNNTNRGKSCSQKGVNYQVEMTQGGRLQGFAYADAAGWLSFYCKTGKNIMNGQQLNCGAVDYAVVVDKILVPGVNPIPPDANVEGDKAYYKLRSTNSSRHAWADSLGWFDMYGLLIPFGEKLNVGTTQCSNGIDDDADGRIDMLDKDCKDDGDDFEDPRQCEDGKDTDGDGLTDYGFPWKDGVNDPACTSFTDNDESADPVLKYSCEDGVDNDGDGKIDLADPGCYTSKDRFENDVQCSDGVDNDGDGKKDLADSGCEGDPEGGSESNTLPAACEDGVDNDGDGKIDFNGKDTNGDGVADIQKDDGCWGFADHGETPTTCSDKLDNDGDGLKDLADPGCSTYEDDKEGDDLLPLSTCSDGKDNDGDKLVDYPERGCYSPADQTEEDMQCNDWTDNDSDGLIDYNGKGAIKPDKDCSFGDDNSEFVAECKDGIDNDGDGKMDMGVDLNGDGILDIPKDDDCDMLDDLFESPDCSDNTDTLQECLKVPQYGSYLTVYPNPYTSPVVADGTSGYKVVVHLAKGDGQTYDPGTYSFEPAPNKWLETFLAVDLFADHTDATTALTWNDLKTNGLVSDFTYVANDDKGLPLNSWVAYVKSPVPTTGIRTSLIVKPKSVDLPGSSGNWTLNSNYLKLNKLKIDKIINKATSELQPGSCALSVDPASCGLVSKEAQLNGTVTGATDLYFKPVVILKKMMSDGQRYLAAVAAVENKIDVEAVYQGVAGAALGKNNVSAEFVVSPYELTNDTNTFIYEWINGGVGTINNIIDSSSSEDSTLVFASVSDLVDVLSSFTVRPLLDPAKEEQSDYVGAPSLLTFVKYTLGSITFKYLPDALPDTETQGIFNPGADIVGLIYSKVLDVPQKDDKYYSTGNLTSNVLRDAITSNLSGILGALQTNNLKANATLTIKNDCKEQSLPSGVIKTDVKGGTLYYVNGQNVVLGEIGGSNMDCGTSDNIVVVQGGNVFIDANLYSDSANRGKWTIAALRTNYGLESLKAGGNIYINKDVTDIYANIAADGSIFSYDGTKSSDGFQVDGRPKSVLSDEDLGKQIFILGSIASWNTFGGSLQIAERNAPQGKPYVLGNGQFTSDQELALVYDLNYLRRFKLYLERYDGVPIDQNCKIKENISAQQQVQNIKDGTPMPCYSIDTTVIYNSLTGAGDLIDVDDSGSSLRAKTLKPANSAPVVVKYEAPSQNNPLFKQRKGANFEKPNF